MNRSSLGRAAWVLALLAALAALAAAPAHAAPPTFVQCGQVITTDTKLAADVVCPSEADSAIFVGADNVTLDLNGHALIAPGVGESDESNGVTATAPRSGLVIKNGTITGFSSGVNFGRGSNLGVSDSLFRNLTIVGMVNVRAAGDGNRFERNDLTGYFTALRLEGANLIADRNVARAGDPRVIEVEGSKPDRDP